MYGLRHYALIIGLALVYFLAGRAGLHFFGLVHPSASAIWIPTGIAIASLLTFGYRVWPAIFAGAFLVNLTTQGSLLTSIGVAAGNTLEGVVAAWLVGRFAGGNALFAQASNIFRFAGVALLASATVSATIGVMTLTLGGYALLPTSGPSGLHGGWATPLAPSSSLLCSCSGIATANGPGPAGAPSNRRFCSARWLSSAS